MTVSAEKATITVVEPSRTVASRSARRTSVTRPLTCVSSTLVAGATSSATVGSGEAVGHRRSRPPVVRTCAVGSGGSVAPAVAAASIRRRRLHGHRGQWGNVRLHRQPGRQGLLLRLPRPNQLEDLRHQEGQGDEGDYGDDRAETGQLPTGGEPGTLFRARFSRRHRGAGPAEG